MANRDLRLIESVKEYIKVMVPKFLEETKIREDRVLQHPLDNDIVEKLEVFEIREDDDDYRIFYYVQEIKEIWKIIIEKSPKMKF